MPIHRWRNFRVCSRSKRLTRFPALPAGDRVSFSQHRSKGLSPSPASVVKILEEAFSKAVREPAFMEFAKRRKMVFNPLNAQEFAKAVTETYPKVEKFQQMLKE